MVLIIGEDIGNGNIHNKTGRYSEMRGLPDLIIDGDPVQYRAVIPAKVNGKGTGSDVIDQKQTRREKVPEFNLVGQGGGAIADSELNQGSQIQHTYKETQGRGISVFIFVVKAFTGADSNGCGYSCHECISCPVGFYVLPVSTDSDEGVQGNIIPALPLDGGASDRQGRSLNSIFNFRCILGCTNRGNEVSQTDEFFIAAVRSPGGICNQSYV